MGSLKSALRLFLPSGWREYGQATLEDYRPLATVSYHFDYVLWGKAACGYIWTNAGIHCANVLLVCLLAIPVLGSAAGACAAALLFAFHPVHAEAVNWVENRSLLLGTTFFLAATLLFIQSNGRGWRCAMSLVTFIAALFSLELNVTLPAFLVAYALCTRRSVRQATVPTLPFWAVAIAFFLFHHHVFGAGDPRKLADTPFTAGTKAATVLETLEIYARLLVFPFHQSADTPFVIPACITALHVLVGLGVLAMVGGALLASSKGEGGIAFALLWLLLALAPTSNVIFLATRPIAEQRLYLPSVGLALLCGALVAIPRSGVQRLAAAALMLLCAASTHRNFVWRSDYWLWRDTAISSPDRWRAWLNLGSAYDKAALLGRAARCYERSLAIVQTPQALNGLARLKRSQGDLAAAAALLGQSLKLKRVAETHANLAAIHAELGRLADAEAEYRQALALSPRLAQAHMGLGDVCRIKGDLPEALERYRQALALSSGLLQAHHNMGVLLKQQADAARAQGHSDAAKRLHEEAQEHFRAVLRAEPASWQASFMLGLICEEQGHVKAARSHYEKALSAKPDSRDVRAALERLRAR
jgi:tetratricopeptide (TPR) repeat protein